MKITLRQQIRLKVFRKELIKMAYSATFEDKNGNIVKQ